MNKSSTGGFTLIEMLVVVIMVGILASIAAPGWLSFVNRQRLSAVRDEMLQTIQAAQSDAQQGNSSYEIHFNSTVGSPVLTIAKDTTPGVSDISTGFETLVGEEKSRSKLKIGAKDINGEDIDAFIFDHKGQIEYVSAPSLTSQGTLPIVIFASLDGVSTRSHCIVVTTLLGSTVTAEGDNCDNPNYIPVP